MLAFTAKSLRASVSPVSVNALQNVGKPTKTKKVRGANSTIARKSLCHSHVDEFTGRTVRAYILEILDWCDSLQFFEMKTRGALRVHTKLSKKVKQQLEMLPGSRGFPLFVLSRYEKTAKALHLETTNPLIILSVLGTQWNLLPEDVLVKINFGPVEKILKRLREL